MSLPAHTSQEQTLRRKVVPQPYGKTEGNRAAVGTHTVTGRDPTTGATTTRTTTSTVRIANSGAIEED